MRRSPSLISTVKGSWPERVCDAFETKPNNPLLFNLSNTEIPPQTKVKGNARVLGSTKIDEPVYS